MGIKLIVTDLDGTFLDTYHTLNEENVKAVRRAREQGIMWPPLRRATGALVNGRLRKRGLIRCALSITALPS